MKEVVNTMRYDGRSIKDMISFAAADFHGNGRAGILARKEMAPKRNVVSNLIMAFVGGTVALPLALKAARYAANVTMNEFAEKLSIRSRGVKVHFALAVVLTSLFPSLTWLYIKAWEPTVGVQIAMWACAACCAMLGYAMLFQYPRALLQIRDYLSQIARDPKMPLQVNLSVDDRDLVRTREHLERVLEELRDKIATIEQQKAQIARAEREKAIAESLATTCHYIGQPATVITAYMDLLDAQDIQPASAKAMVAECQKAVTIMNDLLHKLNMLSDFTSEEYLRNQSGEDKSRLLSLFHAEDQVQG